MKESKQPKVQEIEVRYVIGRGYDMGLGITDIMLYAKRSHTPVVELREDMVSKRMLRKLNGKDEECAKYELTRSGDSFFASYEGLLKFNGLNLFPAATEFYKKEVLPRQSGTYKDKSLVKRHNINWDKVIVKVANENPSLVAENDFEALRDEIIRRGTHFKRKKYIGWAKGYVGKKLKTYLENQKHPMYAINA